MRNHGYSRSSGQFDHKYLNSSFDLRTIIPKSRVHGIKTRDHFLAILLDHVNSTVNHVFVVHQVSRPNCYCVLKLVLCVLTNWNLIKISL